MGQSDILASKGFSSLGKDILQVCYRLMMKQNQIRRDDGRKKLFSYRGLNFKWTLVIFRTNPGIFSRLYHSFFLSLYGFQFLEKNQSLLRYQILDPVLICSHTVIPHNSSAFLLVLNNILSFADSFFLLGDL